MQFVFLHDSGDNGTNEQHLIVRWRIRDYDYTDLAQIRCSLFSLQKAVLQFRRNSILLKRFELYNKTITLSLCHNFKSTIILNVHVYLVTMHTVQRILDILDTYSTT